MRIVVIGGRGYIGRHVAEHLRSVGYEVVVSSRNAGEGDIVWDGCDAGKLAEQLSANDVVINCAGIPIADKLWSRRRKQELIASRVDVTRAIAQAANMSGVKVLISTSAVGYYGNTDDVLVDESGSNGKGFLADLCVEWENAASEFTGRCVVLRLGVVLGYGCGMLAKFTPLFKLGFGGPIGTGRQWLSWIYIDDLARCVEFCIKRNITGVVNAVAPRAVTNSDFARQLASVLRRPCWLPMPVHAMMPILGRSFTNDVLLANQRVMPKALEDAGFKWQTEQLEDALKACYKPQT